MLCNAGVSKSIFGDIQNPCLQPPQGLKSQLMKKVLVRLK